jgi:hypothetical protein
MDPLGPGSVLFGDETATKVAFTNDEDTKKAGNARIIRNVAPPGPRYRCLTYPMHAAALAMVFLAAQVSERIRARCGV